LTLSRWRACRLSCAAVLLTVPPWLEAGLMTLPPRPQPASKRTNALVCMDEVGAAPLLLATSTTPAPTTSATATAPTAQLRLAL
jgi:hypothetical protein